ncbi:hypothetical protein Sjap_005169 [Stephania japonica]|uniref:Uroporphyrinogen decarboxylase (URO-D) domain-containing protein n=1 Tax=Stephania japonica TaxID=461633 RepID=A0AAP0K3S0_9MAGN
MAKLLNGYQFYRSKDNRNMIPAKDAITEVGEQIPEIKAVQDDSDDELLISVMEKSSRRLVASARDEHNANLVEDRLNENNSATELYQDTIKRPSPPIFFVSLHSCSCLLSFSVLVLLSIRFPPLLEENLASFLIIVSLTPLLVQAEKGEPVTRPPAWMMRQAGRYRAVYRKLAEKYPSFRERSETTDLIVEISLQPWKAFHPDGGIIFSDILTPLPAFGVPFDIEEVKGPVIQSPITSEGLKMLHPIDLSKLQFVGDSLQILRQENRIDELKKKLQCSVTENV